MTGYFRNAETEEKSSTEEEAGSEEKPEEVKFNVRSHPNRSYRRTCSLDSDDDSDVSSWSPTEDQEVAVEADSHSVVEADSVEEPETNNNDEHEIEMGRIEFYGVSFFPGQRSFGFLKI